MKRKSQGQESPQKPTWRKITQGTLYPLPYKRSYRIKYKESIQATLEELGNKVNQFELVHPGTGQYQIDAELFSSKKEPEEKKVELVSNPDKEVYSIGHVEGGWYNVISSTGKVMNEQKLKVTDAEALKQILEQETLGEE